MLFIKIKAQTVIRNDCSTHLSIYNICGGAARSATTFHAESFPRTQRISSCGIFFRPTTQSALCWGCRLPCQSGTETGLPHRCSLCMRLLLLCSRCSNRFKAVLAGPRAQIYKRKSAASSCASRAQHTLTGMHGKHTQTDAVCASFVYFFFPFFTRHSLTAITCTNTNLLPVCSSCSPTKRRRVFHYLLGLFNTTKLHINNRT